MIIRGGTGTIRYSEQDYQRVLDAIPTLVKFQLKRNEVLLAGGFIRDTLLNLPVSDLDIFCHSEEKALELARGVAGSNSVTSTICSHSVMHGDLKIQYVFCRVFTGELSLLRGFDFTCCCVSLKWMLEDWVFTKQDNFENDTADRRLIFRCADYNRGNLSALTRAFKFVAKGWTFPQREMAKLVHHYAAYNSDIRSATSRVRTTINPLEPLIDLSNVQSSVNPTYSGTRNREPSPVPSFLDTFLHVDRTEITIPMNTTDSSIGTVWEN